MKVYLNFSLVYKGIVLANEPVFQVNGSALRKTLGEKFQVINQLVNKVKFFTIQSLNRILYKQFIFKTLGLPAFMGFSALQLKPGVQ